MKDYLEQEGFEVKSPRGTIQTIKAPRTLLMFLELL